MKYISKTTRCNTFYARVSNTYSPVRRGRPGRLAVRLQLGDACNLTADQVDLTVRLVHIENREETDELPRSPSGAMTRPTRARSGPSRSRTRRSRT
jgi:hypothetical protein